MRPWLVLQPCWISDESCSTKDLAGWLLNSYSRVNKLIFKLRWVFMQLETHYSELTSEADD